MSLQAASTNHLVSGGPPQATTPAPAFRRCPYYRIAQAGLYGTLNVTDDWSTNYWGSLLSTNLTGGACNIALQYVPTKYRSAFFSNASSPLCGEYLQLTSLYPGRGPCYPVLVDTIDYFNRSALLASPCMGCTSMLLEALHVQQCLQEFSVDLIFLTQVLAKVFQ